MQQGFLWRESRRAPVQLVRRWCFLVGDVLCESEHPLAAASKRVGRVTGAAVQLPPRSPERGAERHAVRVTLEGGAVRTLHGEAGECAGWAAAVGVNARKEAAQLRKLFDVRTDQVHVQGCEGSG